MTSESGALPTVSVVVPSYGRPDHLRTCVTTLLEQDYPGKMSILVVLRPADGPSRAAVEALDAPRVSVVDVREPGFMSALRSGVAAADTDIVAFTDDDAEYPSNWVTRLVQMLTVPGTGGAGGLIREAGKGGAAIAARDIARVTGAGRYRFGLYDDPPVGEHPVHFLCGANMAYWRRAIPLTAFPLVLQHSGGAPGNETLLGAVVRAQGLQLLCATDVHVRHARAPRAEGSRAAEAADVRMLAQSRAFVLKHALSRHTLPLAVARLVLVGDRSLPGLLHPAAARSLPRRLGGTAPVIRGVLQGLATPRITVTSSG